ncbi:hypothetical protein FHR72_005010 [Mycolicibacterium iranicum]|uniref:DUF4190 domain-containing protein n=1 Tax=Mycolicibacterium iranicum TaxID=912594 RepID=A0A839QC24_MYCIR|nr:DUF4190 domain-containing protein [Mycolicibacterium iranicum]MBB2993500.1 hypothetical protein [Mycolicibacterium iranicum]
MTSPDNDPDRAESSGPASGGSEPSSAGYEAPPIEQTQNPATTPDPAQDDTPPQGYTPPPAYSPPTYVPPTPGYDQPPHTPMSGYPPPGDFSGQAYPPPPPSGFAPPYPDAGPPPYPAPPYPGPGYGAAGYPSPPGYGAPGFGTPGYPPSPYGAMPNGYPGGDYGYGAPAPQGSNGLAVGSLVASLIAIPLNLACFSGTVASIVAIVLGIVALGQIKKTGQGGKEMAIAGTAIGALGLLGAFVLALLIAAV